MYAGLKQGTSADNLRRAPSDGTVPDELAWFTPQPGDAVFLKAGTVHSLGGDVVVFEIQQNSDVTFRLYRLGPCRRQDRAAASAHKWIRQLPASTFPRVRFVG